jgi:hypothetical protein
VAGEHEIAAAIVAVGRVALDVLAVDAGGLAVGEPENLKQALIVGSAIGAAAATTTCGVPRRG